MGRPHLNLPILVIAYKRPALLQNLLQIILQNNFGQIYVFCDGAAGNKDQELVQQTKKIILTFRKSNNCKILFEENNLGCGKGVKKALDWFFSENESGIILEDDILPTSDFFKFMDNNLKKYSNNASIASVTGFCPWPNFVDLGTPSLRSKYFSMWGWGTWARVWKNYKLDVDDELEAQWSQAIRRVCNSDNENEFWQNVLKKVKSREIDTWDYQFFFQSWTHNQLHIRPAKNLVQNTGFGDEATHTGVEPWFVKAQKTPLIADEPHWFLEATYFYFRHLTYLDNGNFSLELASKKFQELAKENRKLKLELQKNTFWRPLHKSLKKIFPLKN
jgi:hypothetical protein